MNFYTKSKKRITYQNTFGNRLERCNKNPTSQVIVNQELTEEIKLTRAVRQGCSLSPLLYTLVLEPLLEGIRRNDNIDKIQLPGAATAGTRAYADDTIFFVTADRSINQIIEQFQDCGKASGAKINLTKTKIMNIEPREERTTPPLELQEEKELKIYGLYFTNDGNQTTTKSWKDLLKDSEDTIKTLIHKHTTIFGRAYIISTKILPKLLYQLNIFVPPRSFYNMLNKIITTFTFKRTVSRIRETILNMRAEKGGIGLQNIAAKVTTMRVKTINQMIENKDRFPLLDYYLGLSLIRHSRLNNRTPYYQGETISPFHQSIKDTIRENRDNIGNQNPNQDILPTETEPLYHRMKGMYVFTIVDTGEAFKNLHNPRILQSH